MEGTDMEVLNKETLDQLAVGYAISGKMNDEVAQKIGRFVVEAAAQAGGATELEVVLKTSDTKGCCLEVCILGNCFCAVWC